MAKSQPNGTANVNATSLPQSISLPSRHSQNHQTPLVKTLVVQPIMPVMKATIRMIDQKSISCPQPYKWERQSGCNTRVSYLLAAAASSATSDPQYNKLRHRRGFSIRLLAPRLSLSRLYGKFAEFEYLHSACFDNSPRQLKWASGL